MSVDFAPCFIRIKAIQSLIC